MNSSRRISRLTIRASCLRGWNGSGTIFFGLCNLRCVFCQNWDISQQHDGAEGTADQIANLMLRLQNRGCHNINFVTPEHVARHLLMPNHVDEARRIFEWLAEEISPDTYVNIMDQYRPLHHVGSDSKYDAINRRPDSAELEAAFAAAREAGLWRFDERWLV